MIKGYVRNVQMAGKTYYIIFYDSNRTPLKLKDIGMPYSTNGRYYNLEWFDSSYGISAQDCIFYQSGNVTKITQNITIEMYSGGNKLIFDLPGIEGGGIPSSVLDTLEKGRAYIDASGCVKVKL